MKRMYNRFTGIISVLVLYNYVPCFRKLHPVREGLLKTQLVGNFYNTVETELTDLSTAFGSLKKESGL